MAAPSETVQEFEATGLTYEDLLVTARAGLTGASMCIGENHLTIEDIYCGMDADGFLMVAFVEGVTLESERVYHDKLDQAAVLFDNLSDVAGVYDHTAGKGET